MKKHYITFGIGMILLLSAGCDNREKNITRQVVVVEQDTFDEFGSLILMDTEDSEKRALLYDGNTYNFLAVGDTVNVQFQKKGSRKSYFKTKMLYEEEVILDPGDTLRNKKAEQISRIRDTLIAGYKQSIEQNR